MNIIFTHRLEVRFRDCDPLGHANNAVFLTYLEQARFNHWRALWGFGDRGRDNKPGVILARAEIDYRLPARFGDVLEVRIGLLGIGRTSFTYEYEIANDTGRIVATAKTVQVMYDYKMETSVPIPPDIRAKLSGGLPPEGGSHRV